MGCSPNTVPGVRVGVGLLKVVCAGSSLLCGLSLVSASRRYTLSSCGARASRWEAQPQAPRVCGFQLLQRVGLVVAIQELSYSAACGIFPDQGSNLCLPHWQADSLPLRHVGSPGKVV